MMTSEHCPVSLFPPASPAQPGHFARPKLLPYHHHHPHQIRQNSPIINSSDPSSSNVNWQEHPHSHESPSKSNHQRNSSSFGQFGYSLDASAGHTVNLVILPSSNESSTLSLSSSTSPASSNSSLEPGTLKSNIYLPPFKLNNNHGSPTKAPAKKSSISPPLSCSFASSPPLILSSSKSGPGDVSDSNSLPVTSSPYQCNDRLPGCNLRSETRVKDPVDWSHLFGYPNELTSSTSSSLISSTSSAVSSSSNDQHPVTINNNNKPTGDRPHLHALHRLRREIAKELASSCRVLIRDNSNRSRPSLLALGRDFFCRFTDREKVALSSFDFLDEYYTNDCLSTLPPSSYNLALEEENYTTIDYTYVALSCLNPQCEEGNIQCNLVDVPSEASIANECRRQDETNHQRDHISIVQTDADVTNESQCSGDESDVVSLLATCDENHHQPKQEDQLEHCQLETISPGLHERNFVDSPQSSFRSSPTIVVDGDSECTNHSPNDEPPVPHLFSNCIDPHRCQSSEEENDVGVQVTFESTELPSETICDEGDEQEQDTPKHLPSSNDSIGSDSCDLSSALTRYHQMEYLPDGVTELADDLVCLLAEYNTGNESNDVSPLNNYCLSEVEEKFQVMDQEDVKDGEEPLLPQVSPGSSSQSPNVIPVMEEVKMKEEEKHIQVYDDLQVNLKADDFFNPFKGIGLCDLVAFDVSEVHEASPPLHHQVSLSSEKQDGEHCKPQQILVQQQPQPQQPSSSSSSGQVAVDDPKGKERPVHYSCTNKGRSRKTKHRQRRKQQGGSSRSNGKNVKQLNPVNPGQTLVKREDNLRK